MGRGRFPPLTEAPLCPLSQVEHQASQSDARESSGRYFFPAQFVFNQWLVNLFTKLKASHAAKAEPENLRRGKLGEQAAKKHLQKQGLKFLAANFRTERGEIDPDYGPTSPCRIRGSARGC